MKFVCPVCGYSELTEPPRNEFGGPSFEICDCCGVQFGYEDISEESILNYRDKWIKCGCKWFSQENIPLGWSLEEQLKNIK